MTNFPNEIRVNLIHAKTKEPIPNVIVHIGLFAKHKNNYNFFTTLSDGKGRIIITKAWLEKQIYLQVSIAIMDYSSSLEDCKPSIEFEIVGQEKINRAIESLKIWANITADFKTNIDNLISAENYKYFPCTRLIHINKKVDLQEYTICLNKKL